MKNIYLAGPCSSEYRTIVEKIAKSLQPLLGKDWNIYCPWRLKIREAWSYSQEDRASLVFINDREMIDICDIFIMISCGHMSSAGTNWEQGYAFGLNKPIIVLQITNQQTSLMTYCGCDIFINSNKDTLKDDLQYIADLCTITPSLWNKEKCKTILT